MTPPDLEHWHQFQQTIAHLCPQHFPLEDSEQLAILLLQQLAQNLQADRVSAFWNDSQAYGEAVDLTTLELSGLTPNFALPNTPLPAPKFTPGTHLEWKSLPEDTDDSDTGVVIGSFYAPSQIGWQWKYLVLLDRAAYSRQFCVADTAWEKDLERLPPEISRENSP